MYKEMLEQRQVLCETAVLYQLAEYCLKELIMDQFVVEMDNGTNNNQLPAPADSNSSEQSNLNATSGDTTSGTDTTSQSQNQPQAGLETNNDAETQSDQDQGFINKIKGILKKIWETITGAFIKIGTTLRNFFGKKKNVEVVQDDENVSLDDILLNEDESGTEATSNRETALQDQNTQSDGTQPQAQSSETIQSPNASSEEPTPDYTRMTPEELQAAYAKLSEREASLKTQLTQLNQQEEQSTDQPQPQAQSSETTQSPDNSSSTEPTLSDPNLPAPQPDENGQLPPAPVQEPQSPQPPVPAPNPELEAQLQASQARVTELEQQIAQNPNPEEVANLQSELEKTREQLVEQRKINVQNQGNEHEHQMQVDELNQQIQTLTNNLNSSDEKIKQLRAQLNAAQTNGMDKNKLETLQDQIAALEKQKQDANAEIGQKRQRIQALEAEKNNLNSTVSQQKQQIETLTNEKTSLTSQIADKDKVIQNINQQLANQNANFQRQSQVDQTKIQQLEQQFQQATSEKEQLNQQLTNVNQQIQTLTTQNQQLTTDNDTLKTTNATLSATNQTLTDENTQLNSDIAKKVARLETREKIIKALFKDRHEKEECIRQMGAKNVELYDKNTTLEQEKQKLEQDNQQLEQEKQKLNQKIADQLNEISKLKSEQNTMNNRMAIKDETITQLQSQLTKLQTDVQQMDQLRSQNAALQQQMKDLQAQQMVVINFTNLMNMKSTSNENDVVKQMKSYLKHVKCKLSYDGRTQVSKMSVMKYILPKSADYSVKYMDTMILFAKNLAIFQNMIARKLMQKNAVTKALNGTQLYDQSNSTFSGETDPNNVRATIQKTKDTVEKMVKTAMANPKQSVYFEEVEPNQYLSQLSQYNQFIEEQGNTGQAINKAFDELFTENGNSKGGRGLDKAVIKNLFAASKEYYGDALKLFMSTGTPEQSSNPDQQTPYTFYMSKINEAEQFFLRNAKSIYQAYITQGGNTVQANVVNHVDKINPKATTVSSMVA